MARHSRRQHRERLFQRRCLEPESAVESAGRQGDAPVGVQDHVRRRQPKVANLHNGGRGRQRQIKCAAPTSASTRLSLAIVPATVGAPTRPPSWSAADSRPVEVATSAGTSTPARLSARGRCPDAGDMQVDGTRQRRVGRVDRHRRRRGVGDDLRRARHPVVDHGAPLPARHARRDPAFGRNGATSGSGAGAILEVDASSGPRARRRGSSVSVPSSVAATGTASCSAMASTVASGSRRHFASTVAGRSSSNGTNTRASATPWPLVSAERRQRERVGGDPHACQRRVSRPPARARDCRMCTCPRAGSRRAGR